jgi:hypothetical protein
MIGRPKNHDIGSGSAIYDFNNSLHGCGTCRFAIGVSAKEFHSTPSVQRRLRQPVCHVALMQEYFFKREFAFAFA